MFVTVKNCKSETLYKKSEIESKKETNYKLGNTGSKDCYVGGLIGYARLTNIVDCNNDNTKDADFSGPMPLICANTSCGSCCVAKRSSSFFVASLTSASKGIADKRRLQTSRPQSGMLSA